MTVSKIIKLPLTPTIPDTPDNAETTAGDAEANEVRELLANLPDLEDCMADVIDGIGDGFSLYDQDDRILLWNSRFAEIISYAKPVLRSGASYDLLLRKCAEEFFKNQKISAEEKEAWIQEGHDFQKGEGTYERQTKDGRSFLVTRRRTKQNRVAVVWSDITKQKQAEAVAQESEALYRELFEKSILGIAVMDRRRVLRTNNAFRKIFGFGSNFETITLQDFENVVALHERVRVRKIFQSLLRGDPAAIEFEMECVRADGAKIWVEASSSQVTWKGRTVSQTTFVDVTEKRDFQEQLIANKLESVGELAHGIAKEFYETFSAVMAKVQLANLEAYSAGLDDISGLLHDADQLGSEIYDMIQRLLFLYTKGIPRKQNTSVEMLLRDSLPFSNQGENIVSIRKSKADLKVDIKNGVSMLRVDRHQIVTALRSLIARGLQTMPFGGTMTVRAENYHIKRKIPGVMLPNGKFVRISIIDQGGGETPEVLERFFDPYVKAPYKNGGLALAGAYSIVKHHGGAIAVSSKIGKGTRVDVILPAEVQ